MILTSSILEGFIRLLLLLLFLYYCNNKLVKRTGSHTLIQFIVVEWFKYGSLSVIVVFVLIQMQIYSLMNFLLAMLLIILIDVEGIKNFKNPFKYFNNVARSRFFELLKDDQNKKSLKERLQLERPKLLNDDRVYIFYTVLIIISLAFIGRYYFYVYDTFLFSDLWISDLHKIIRFDDYVWFDSTIGVEGELAIINLYSKLVDVSSEVGLQSYSIIEDVLLALIVFWSVRQITNSAVLAPMIAFISYIFLYSLSPIEINYLLQNHPVLTGLSFAVPAMVIILKPNVIHFKKTNYFISLSVCFFAIGLVDLFTLLVLLPPFFVLALFVVNKENIYFKWIAILAYLVGTALVLGTYFIASIHYQNDFIIFLKSSLISVSSFSYMPNIYIPFEKLVTYYQYGSLFSITILLYLIWYKKETWKPSLVFMIYFNVLVSLSFLNSNWIDTDSLRVALSVFIPICYGITAAVIIRLFSFSTKKLYPYKYPIATVLSALILFTVVYLQIDIIKNATKSDKTPRMTLDAYDKIFHSYFPYSYAIVNDNVTQTLSINKHFFINYEDFLYGYLEKDSIYHHNKLKPNFLRDNPQAVIPNSILVFVYHDKTETNNLFSDQNELEPLLKENIELLKRRGRKVSVFYKSPYVDVFEIINEPKSSKIDDLIY